MQNLNEECVLFGGKLYKKSKDCIDLRILIENLKELIPGVEIEDEFIFKFIKQGVYDQAFCVRIAFLWLIVDHKSKTFELLEKIVDKEYTRILWAFNPYIERDDIFNRVLLKLWCLPATVFSEHGINFFIVKKVVSYTIIDYLRKIRGDKHVDLDICVAIPINNNEQEKLQEISIIIDKVRQEKEIPEWLLEIALDYLKGLHTFGEALLKINGQKEKSQEKKWTKDSLKSFLKRLKKDIRAKILAL